jgi:nicotinamide riboside transporter PnuC
MNPMLRTFLRLTLLIAVVLVGLWLLAAVFHFVIIAAIVAAIVMGGLFLYNAVRRRTGIPVIRR